MLFTEARRSELKAITEAKYSDVYNEYGGTITIQLNGSLSSVVRSLRASDPEEYDDLRAGDIKRSFIDSIKHLGRNMRVGSKKFKVVSADYNSHNDTLEISWEAPLKDHKDEEAASDAAEIAITGKGNHFHAGLVDDVSKEWEAFAALIYGHPTDGKAPKVTHVEY